jgi:hypothetical protein
VGAARRPAHATHQETALRQARHSLRRNQA